MHSRRVGEVLEDIRRRAGLRKNALAALGPVDPSMVSRWMSGKSRPDVTALRRLSDGVALKYPELTGLAEELIEAAGYGEQPPMPDIVRDNWGDRSVRGLWQNEAHSPETRLRLVTSYLRETADEGADFTDRERGVMEKFPEAVKGLVEYKRGGNGEGRKAR